LLKSKEEVGDIFQEIFIRLWELRSFINPDLSLSSFFYTMARNRIFNYFRDIDIDEKVKQILSAQAITEVEAVDSHLIYAEYQKILQNAIGQLPPQRQRVFTMSRIECMPHKGIAAELNISVNTVQEHISEAIKFIKAYFNKNADISINLLLTVFVLYK
jgi:RNA polymerase sigma-70 factor (ECF subfamily)